MESPKYKLIIDSVHENIILYNYVGVPGRSCTSNCAVRIGVAILENINTC